MNQRVDMLALLSRVRDERDRAASFALLSLGVVKALAAGALTATGAVEAFFHADHCLYVRRQLRHAVADEIMSRGVQLPDLFAALPVEEAQGEFQRELAALRALCLKMLNDQRTAA